MLEGEFKFLLHVYFRLNFVSRALEESLCVHFCLSSVSQTFLMLGCVKHGGLKSSGIFVEWDFLFRDGCPLSLWEVPWSKAFLLSTVWCLTDCWRMPQQPVKSSSGVIWGVCSRQCGGDVTGFTEQWMEVDIRSLQSPNMLETPPWVCLELQEVSSSFSLRRMG